ncbi:MAG: hypothetical protein ACHQZR_09880 [Candidatus Limnocylindrales bacterium]
MALAVIRPFQAGPASYDAGSSVIHFLRLTSGQRLEAFISTTPKPLLTLVYGGLYQLFGDWRAISWATIGAYGVAIALTSWLAWRVAGPVAAVVAAIALIASPTLMGEVIIASAVPWAMVGWAVAGLAVTAQRPRYVLAGLALMVAALARLETLVVVALILLMLAVLWLWGRREGRQRVPPGAWWVLLGFLALPIMLLHDWLLTGDPLFWASVSTRYSEGAGAASLMDPFELARFLAHRYLGMAPFTALAVVGAVWLLRERQWAVAIGLAALGPGLVSFLFFLSARGTFVATRYAVPIDIAVLFSAAVGAGALVKVISGWVRSRDPSATHGVSRSRTVLVVVVAGLACLVAGWPPALLAPGTQATAAAALRLAEQERAAVPVLDAALLTMPNSRAIKAAAGERPLVLLVPVPMRTLLAADLGLPLSRLGSTSAAGLVPAPGSLALTYLVYHDRAGDRPDSAYAELEAGEVTRIGGLTLTPVLADAGRGMWIYSITGP